MSARETSTDVRIWSIETYKGKRGATYYVRWSVAGCRHKTPRKTRALADSFRAQLLTASRKGEPFEVNSGLPVSMIPKAAGVSWYEHACAFADATWPRSAPRTRQSRADALATATTALLRSEPGRPEAEQIRDALYGWAFIRTRRESGLPPEHLADAVKWLERGTVALRAFEDVTVAHAVLDALSRRADGKPAAPNTIARKRAVLYSALRYAVDLGRLDSHPLDRVHWKAEKVAEQVDRRSVVDHPRARRLLAAVANQGVLGRRLRAFFGCMYYSALRPSEVIALRKADIASLPGQGWAEIALNLSDPATSRQWTDAGTRQPRQLKHRSRDDVRFVPVPPPLTQLIRTHLTEHGTAPDGRLFWSPRGGPLAEAVYGRVWREARLRALTPEEYASPLAARPYDLRHAAVSTWLNAGVPATQVAEWAGHSVHVLLKVYAKCIVGQEEAARQRIEAALNAA
jgi:integrase